MAEFQEKFKALGLGKQIIAVAAIVLFIDGFLPWYSVDLGPFGSVNRSGWESPGSLWSILAILIGIAMLAVIAVQTFAKEGTLPDNISGVTWPKIFLGMGIASVVLVVIKFLDHNGDLGFGFFIGIICVVALAAGGFLLYQDEAKGKA